MTDVDLVVIGGGPGGYTAAFRAADLGLKSVLVERRAVLGGVCLNVGCIPSKTLLHAVSVMRETREMEHSGVCSGALEIDVARLREKKEQVIGQLNGGLAGLAKRRKVEVIQGEGRFVDSNALQVSSQHQTQIITFKHAIIACGSRPALLPNLPSDDPRIIHSSQALALKEIPERMLVVGGGIIGLEMATLYSGLGSTIDIVELQPGLIPGCDRDLVRPLQKRLAQWCSRIMLSTRVKSIESKRDVLEVCFDGEHAPDWEHYDRVLVAIGRIPNGDQLGAEEAGITVDPHGFIPVDRKQRTNVSNIYAVGDVSGAPMLAHKASHEAKIAAEEIAGLATKHAINAIPSVAYTDPEVAWVGLTENHAKEQGIEYKKSIFPWAASGRAAGIGRTEGMTKLLYCPQDRQLLGAGIVGLHAGELIGEMTLALTMGATIDQVAHTVHPHPSLSETLGLAAEVATGSITDLMPPRERVSY